MANSSITPETTMSRCTMAVESATLSFEVNYPQIDGTGGGQFVSSSTFRVGGYDWSLRFYPDGIYADCGGNASCYACSPNRSMAARTSYLIQIVEKNNQGRGGEEEPVLSSSDDKSPEQLGCSLTLQDACWGMGYPKFVPKSQLKSLSEKPGGDGGRFTVKCLITVANESPPMELPGHLGRMLLDGTGADVKFRVGRPRFRAHGFVLAARSPVFQAQLFGPMAEKDLRRVKVVGVEPAVFEAMLGYIYTDSLPPPPREGGGYSLAEMQHLLVAADRYGLDALKLRCEEELCGKIGLESVTDMLRLANQHQCELLKAACWIFMSSPDVLSVILETDGFKEHFMAVCRPVALEGGTLGTESSRRRRREEEVGPSQKVKKIGKKYKN